MNDLPKHVAGALAAANANDTAAFLACFTPDGVVDDWGREFRGPDEIRAWSDQEFIGVHVSLVQSNPSSWMSVVLGCEV